MLPYPDIYSPLASFSTYFLWRFPNFLPAGGSHHLSFIIILARSRCFLYLAKGDTHRGSDTPARLLLRPFSRPRVLCAFFHFHFHSLLLVHMLCGSLCNVFLLFLGLSFGHVMKSGWGGLPVVQSRGVEERGTNGRPAWVGPPLSWSISRFERVRVCTHECQLYGLLCLGFPGFSSVPRLSMTFASAPWRNDRLDGLRARA